MRKLAMLLAVCILAASFPALSEVVESEAVDEVVGEAFGETGAPGLIAEPEGDAPDEFFSDGLAAEGTDPFVENPYAFSDETAPEADLAQTPVDLNPQYEADPASGAFAVEAALPGEEMPQEIAAASQDAAQQAVEEQAAVQALPPHYDPNGPQLNAYDVTLGVGEWYALTAWDAAQLAQSGISMSYASPNEAVAVVTAEGVVQAIGPGDVRLTATASNGTYAECDVHVRFAPEAVAFNVPSIEIGKGETTDALKVAMASAAGECAGGCTFASSSAKVVTVDEKGVIYGKKRGSAVINVTTYNGLTASCIVTVKKAPKKVTLPSEAITMGVGEVGQLAPELPKNSASRLTFASEAPGIVAVDATTGAMQAVAVGTTRVAVRTFNGKYGIMTVTVLPAPQTLSFGGTEFVMGVGMSTSAVASVDAGAAPSVVYAVANPSIAAFDNGAITALNVGETEVVATTYNGLSAVCRLIVKPAPQYVRMPYATLTIGLGESVRLQPDVGDSASTFAYKSSSKKRVSVSADGVITALKTGKATITVTTYNRKRFKLKVVVQREPTAVALAVSPASAELGIGESVRITSNLDGSVAYASANPAVAQVDAQSGVVTGIAPGTTQIVATAADGQQAVCSIAVYGPPEWIATDTDVIELSRGQTWQLNVQVSPGSRAALRYASQNPAIATVSQEGIITAVAAGQTVIAIETGVEGVSAQVMVTVVAAPESLTLAVTEQTLNVNETCQMQPIVPEGTVTTFTYASSDETVATISQDGAVLARGRGTAMLAVSTANGLTAYMKLTVLDPWYPESASLLNAPGILAVGQTVQLSYALTPESAVAEFEWSSSNPDVISVSGDGLLSANALGYARINAQSRKNSTVALELTVAVTATELTLTIPARTTDIAGIPENLAKIDAIRTCAIGQIDAMQAANVISESDASKRRSMVNNAFADYAFPWMTPAYQAYWKAANSEGGVKDFQPDRVYYGLPYISGSGSNRLYNASRALAEARYTDSGAGYYLLNQGNLLKDKYCGNDCSGFLNAAIWGINSSHSADRTTEIASVSAYRTIKDYGAMRTGDLICKSSAHVVMFLYYTNADKSQIMIIENGGVEPGTNTVHCIIMDVAFYQSNGYIVRRLASLG